MPLRSRYAKEDEKSYSLDRPALWLALVLMVSWPIGAQTLVNAGVATEPGQGVSDFVPAIASGIDDAAHALGPDTVLRSADATSELNTGKILRELGKQTIDQPGHFLIAATPIWASRYLVGVPWYGWVATPLLAYREWLQWPSNRWWDPPLDWAFLSLGVVVATWRRRSTHRLWYKCSSFRRRIAR